MDEDQLRFDMRLRAVEKDLAQGAKRFEHLEKSQEFNTRITLETRQEVGKLASSINELGVRMAGPVEVYEGAAKGLSYIGKAGSAIAWVAHRWYLVLAVAVAFKAWSAGGSWSEVWAAVERAFAQAPR